MDCEQEVALEALAEADPCSLADTASLRALHARVLNSSAVAGSGGSSQDDVARLHALFSVALNHGLVSVVVHYVQEVRAPRGLWFKHE